jgi:flagellar basal-body rod modification protein FlgD
MGIISPIATDTNGNPIAAEAQRTLGKDDFLKLLITKLTHQDPLSPMDDEAFVAQLAQFSSLEQLQNVNNSLEESLNWDYLQMQTINNTMATGLIGREVKASYSGVYLDANNRPTISFSSSEYAQKVNVQICDSTGAVIRTLADSEVPPGANRIVWDGLDQNGQRMGEGYYTIKVSAVNAAGETFTPSTFLQGKVNGITYRDGAAFLQVDGMEIPLSEINSITEYTEEDD